MTDPRIEAAIDHWAPRFVEHGVPVGDFLDVTGSIDSWDDWCSAWTAAGEVHEREGDVALAGGYLRSAGLHYLTAAVEYHFGKFLFCHDPAQMRATHALAVAAHRKAHPLIDPPVERIEFPYLGVHTLVGNLRLPAGVDRPPVVLLIPGLDRKGGALGARAVVPRSRHGDFLDRWPGSGRGRIRPPHRDRLREAGWGGHR